MKKVYCLRHADWDTATGHLSEKGQKQCQEVKKQLPQFTDVFSSIRPRAQETAECITAKRPLFDTRINPIDMASKELATLIENGKIHPYGMAGAILDTPSLVEPLKKRGEEAKALLDEILLALPNEQSALIISHDGVIVALEKVIKHESFDNIIHAYKPLEGFIVDENMRIQQFTIH